MFVKIRIEADVTLPEKREKAGGCCDAVELMLFERSVFPLKHVSWIHVLGSERIQIGTETVPTSRALFSLHLRRIIELSNTLPMFSGQKAGHVFVQFLVCLSSAPGFVFFSRVRRPPQSGAGATGWPRRRPALGRSYCC